MLSTLLTLLLLGGVALGLYIYFGKSKLSNRLKSRAEDVHDTLADAAGNAIDDRNIKIKQGQEAHDKITRALVALLTDLNLTGEKVEKNLVEAEKFTNIAKRAKQDGNMDAAKEAISKATVAEQSANSYKVALTNLEAQRDKLIAQRDKLGDNIDNAKANTAIYKARFSAAELQNRMLQSEAFGGVDSLNFDEDDEALARLEAENSARASLDTEPDSALETYTKSVDNDELERKLNEL